MNFGYNGKNRVKFPTDEKIVVHFDSQDPWQAPTEEHSLTPENLIDAYRYACEKQNVPPIESLVKQLENYNTFNVRGHDLILKNEQLNYKQIEALEEILKKIQFRLIDLEGCNLDEDGATALFEMIEYYESATHLDISGNTNLGLSVRVWESFNRMLSKTVCLQHLVLKDSDLSDKSCIVIYRALRNKGSHLISLNLENSNIQGRSFPGLVSSLKDNPTLRELFLGNNFLSEMDAKNLKHLLLNNSTLELLDLHCNEFNDECLKCICEGLAEQPAGPGDGLKILNLSNNLITARGINHIVQALPFCRNLKAIDLSFNKICNDGLNTLLNGLFERCKILVLSLKGCEINCEGAILLAEYLKKYKRLKQIDLRENEIKKKGLIVLNEVLSICKNITLLEVSDRADADEEFKAILKEMKEKCAQNKLINQQDVINKQQQQSTQLIMNADNQLYQNSLILNGDIWNNVSLTSMNGTSSLSSTPRFSLSELFKPINTLTTTVAAIHSKLELTTPPPVPPSTPNNQQTITPNASSTNLHSIKNSPQQSSVLHNQTDLENLNSNASLEDQVKLHMFSMSLDYNSPSLSSNNSYNSSQTSSDLRQYSSSPGSRFKISQVDSKFLRSNSINETAVNESSVNRSAPINTTSTNNRMMRSCSLGSWNSKYDKNERVSRSGRFSVSPVPDEIQNVDFDNDKNGRWSENSISETEEFNITNENNQNQFNFNKPTIDLNNKSINKEILFTITNLDADKQQTTANPFQQQSSSPINISPSITIQTDEDDRSIGNVSEVDDFVPELNQIVSQIEQQPKKLSLLLPETLNQHNKNRRMSTPAISSASQQANKRTRPKIPNLKILISPDLNALDLKSSVPLSPTSLCRTVPLCLNPEVEEFFAKFSS